MCAAMMIVVWISSALSLLSPSKAMSCIQLPRSAPEHQRSCRASDGTKSTRLKGLLAALRLSRGLLCTSRMVKLRASTTGIRHDEQEGASSALGSRAEDQPTLCWLPVSCGGEHVVIVADRETFSRCSPGFTIRSTLPWCLLCYQHSRPYRSGSPSSDG